VIDQSPFGNTGHLNTAARAEIEDDVARDAMEPLFIPGVSDTA
jgi:hypothetical protein